MTTYSTLREEAVAYYRLMEQARAIGIPTSLDDPRSPRTIEAIRVAVATVKQMADNSLAAVKRAARRRVSVENDYRAAIRAAHDAGHSLRAIGEAAGVSHVRVLKILRGE